jgi:hypothetical protein
MATSDDIASNIVGTFLVVVAPTVEILLYCRKITAMPGASRRTRAFEQGASGLHVVRVLRKRAGGLGPPADRSVRAKRPGGGSGFAFVDRSGPRGDEPGTSVLTLKSWNEATNTCSPFRQRSQ